jgi:NAD(P)-dependent dehydrogenase (short-subunit alcohol dehydrogenase family)
MDYKLKGKVALVTGAGSQIGYGKATALTLAKEGCDVIVNDINLEDAEKTAAEIVALGRKSIAIKADITKNAEVQAMVKKALAQFGKIDILVNNAGILRDKSFLKMEMEDYEKVIAVHLNGTFFCSKAAFPHMRENAYGRIVSAASAAGVYGNFGQANYGAAKMGIIGLMHVLKQEGAKYNIMANVIVPVAGTRMTATVLPPNLLELLKPEYVSPLVAWACSENCTFSGYTLSAGGGYFSRTAFMEGPGVIFDVSKPITLEMIDENIDKITSLEGAMPYGSATEQTGAILGKMNPS